MDQEQKACILAMRQEGLGYAEIAKHLGLSRETVKTHCRRHGLLTQQDALNYIEPQKAPPSYDPTICKNCGGAFNTKPWRQRVFCCHDCYIHFRFRVQPKLLEEEKKQQEVLCLTREELQRAFDEMLSEMIKTGASPWASDSP